MHIFKKYALILTKTILLNVCNAVNMFGGIPYVE